MGQIRRSAAEGSYSARQRGLTATSNSTPRLRRFPEHCFARTKVLIVGTDFTSFIKRSELARDRSEQRPDRFAAGQKVDARVIQFDRRAHKISVSIKALEVAEEKEAIAQYGSSDSGATLGDILGTALKRKGEESVEESEKKD